VKTRRSGRRRGRRGPLGAARLVRIVAAAVAVLFVGWWAMKITVVNALTRENPFLVARIAPSDPRTAMALAMTEFALRNGRVGAGAERDARAALGRAALADEPFLLDAVAAAVAHDDARSERLLTEARRRNPRGRFTRLLLLNLYLRQGRAEEAGIELAALGRLIPDSAGALVPELSRLARDPKTRPGAARMLRRNPELRDLTLASLAGSADPNLVLALAAASGSGGDPAHPPQWQSVLLGRLIAAGDVERAYQLWRSATHLAGSETSKGLYDAGFAGAPGAPPFNWELTTDSEGVAERTHGSLQVDYYGRAERMLARQLLILKPGTYRLQMRAEGAAKGQGTKLVWSVICTDGKAPLVQLPLTEVDSAPRRLSASFTVPAGCRAQWLRLDGAPGDVAAEQAATLSNLEIVPAAGR
jgi:hypothetical protein